MHSIYLLLTISQRNAGFIFFQLSIVCMKNTELCCTVIVQQVYGNTFLCVVPHYQKLSDQILTSTRKGCTNLEPMVFNQIIGLNLLNISLISLALLKISSSLRNLALPNRKSRTRLGSTFCALTLPNVRL
jgi:hypothetical protein